MLALSKRLESYAEWQNAVKLAIAARQAHDETVIAELTSQLELALFKNGLLDLTAGPIVPKRPPAPSLRRTRGPSRKRA
jgi:hypothetical protein